jgi:hypothetical protein
VPGSHSGLPPQDAPVQTAEPPSHSQVVPFTGEQPQSGSVSGLQLALPPQDPPPQVGTLPTQLQEASTGVQVEQSVGFVPGSHSGLPPQDAPVQTAEPPSHSQVVPFTGEQPQSGSVSGLQLALPPQDPPPQVGTLPTQLQEASMGQHCALQDWEEGPEQLVPPQEGIGFVQARVCVPPPQDAEQDDQALQPPSTGTLVPLHAPPEHLSPTSQLLPSSQDFPSEEE